MSPIHRVWANRPDWGAAALMSKCIQAAKDLEPLRQASSSTGAPWKPDCRLMLPLHDPSVEDTPRAHQGWIAARVAYWPTKER